MEVSYGGVRLDHAVFVELVQTEGTSQSGSSERKWSSSRSAQFGITRVGDTLVVTADSLELSQLADATQRTINVDPVIGARWRLFLTPDGAARVVVQPFVPAEIADVSDIAIAMNDFLPPAPTSTPARQAQADGARSWRQVGDSAGVSRYRWSQQARRDSNYVTPDNVSISATIDSHENGAVAWDRRRGPVAWIRNIESTVDTHYAGRTVRALVTQRIAVRRLR